MRLVTWNARKGQFLRKSPLLEPLRADIAVVQEIAAPASESTQTLWFGDTPNLGIAVVAKEPYKVRRLPELLGVPKYVIPIAVEGPRSFVLFAVWTLGGQPMRYVTAASTAIDMYESTFATSTVVLIIDIPQSCLRWLTW